MKLAELRGLLQKDPDALQTFLRNRIQSFEGRPQRSLTEDAQELQELLYTCSKLLGDNLALAAAHSHVRDFEEACRDYLCHELAAIVKSTGAMPTRGSAVEVHERYMHEKTILEMDTANYRPAVQGIQGRVNELRDQVAKLEKTVEKKQQRIVELTSEKDKLREELAESVAELAALEEGDEEEHTGPAYEDLELEVESLKARLQEQRRAYVRQLKAMAQQIAETDANVCRTLVE